MAIAAVTTDSSGAESNLSSYGGCQRPCDEGEEVVPSLPAAVEPGAHDYVDLHARVIFDPQTVLLSTNHPSANESSKFYSLSRICSSIMLVTQSCPTLCSPMDCSLPGSPVHGILQARIL